VSLAALIAAQRADYGIPHAVSCRALGVSQAWYYKWRNGDGSPQRHRRKALAATIAWLFAKHKGTYGSPRIVVDLREMGWRVSVNTVAALMAEQRLVARRTRRRRGTTKPDSPNVRPLICWAGTSPRHRNRTWHGWEI
jgi:putative transposase